ncbi:MAG: hypothetical protein NVS1B10_07910 [Candidatus Saccharimonadales bacterium]
MSDTPSKKPKRLVKNPETFRERALKASQAPTKESKVKKIRSTTGKIFIKPVKNKTNSFGKAFKNSPFKFLLPVFRLIGKVVVPVYFRQSWTELRQVSWPTIRQSRQLTFAVIVFAVIFGATIALVDYGLDKIFKNVLLK